MVEGDAARGSDWDDKSRLLGSPVSVAGHVFRAARDGEYFVWARVYGRRNR